MRNFPDAIAKRDLMFHARKKVSPEQLVKLAGELEAAGWLNDAVDFLAQAKDKMLLQKLRARASAEGDTFLFLKISRHLPEDADFSRELTACATKAEASGKLRYAIKAFERLGSTAEAERIRATIATDGDIVSEAESKVFIPPAPEELEDT